MKIEKVHSGIRYTLSNEGLKVGDSVFPIAMGRCLEDGGWILNSFDFRGSTTGFPDDPHTILDLDYDNGRQGKAYQVRTDRGYSPIECYYKITKTEEHTKIKDGSLGGRYEWTEMEEDKTDGRN